MWPRINGTCFVMQHKVQWNEKWISTEDNVPPVLVLYLLCKFGEHNPVDYPGINSRSTDNLSFYSTDAPSADLISSRSTTKSDFKEIRQRSLRF